MHLCQCLHPQRIFNKYANEFQYVPCGKCEACKNAHASYWVQRLQMERRCWKYCLFVTLTYSNEKLPCFVTSSDGRYLCAQPRSFNPSEDVPIYDLNDLFLQDNSSDDFRQRNETWLSNILNAGGRVPHLSRYHCQLFIKRLRKTLINYATQSGSKNIREDALCRYFICGEYGETTLRPHYHCLFFFNSVLEASYIQKAIYTSWKDGIVDSSFVANDNSSYVASYVNSISKLPLLYQQRQVRPFFLCSKAPTIGSLFFPEQEIREIFNSSSPTFVIPQGNGEAFVDVPLWRSFKDSLFPKLAFFDHLSNDVRAQLYRAVQRFEEFSGKEACCVSFVKYMKYMYMNNRVNRFFTNTYKQYLDTFVKFNDLSKLDDFLIRLFYVSNRVFHQSVIFGCSITYYISRIENFYKNCEELQLKKYFRFQEDYSEEYGQNTLVGLDFEFIHSMVNLDIYNVTSDELIALESYGLDTAKFFAEDLSERYKYIETIIPQNAKEFRLWYEHSKLLSNKRVKNKKKNDYLLKQNNPVLEALSNF